MTRLAGVVVDDEGQPIAGATVKVTDISQRGCSIVFSPWQGLTDANGRFETTVLPTGEYDVVAGWSTESFSNHYETEPTVARTGESNIRIVLRSGGTITGRVVLDGVPLSSYAVVVAQANVLASDPIEVRSEDGRFTFFHIAPGVRRVRVLAPGTRSRFVDDIQVDHRVVIDLGDIAMQRGQRIRGRVLDLDGRPVIDARVQIGWWGEVPTYRSQLGARFEGYYETRTDHQGEYVFEGIDTQTMRVRRREIWATHETGAASTLVPLPSFDARIDLTLLSTGNIEARADGLDGRRAGATATQVDEPRFARLARPDEDGLIRFAKLPIGDYVIRLADLEGIPTTVTVTAGQTTTIVLQPAIATVEVVFRLPRGRARPLVTRPAIPGIQMWSNLAEESRCTHSFVPVGEYEVSLDGTRWRTITIAASPTHQTIDLR